jgi:hypothetical protein
MQGAGISDADEMYLRQVADDCERLLGPGIELDGLDLDEGNDVVLRLRYRLGKLGRATEGHGETVVAAHADLRHQLVLDRIRLATSALYRWRR